MKSNIYSVVKYLLDFQLLPKGTNQAAIVQREVNEGYDGNALKTTEFILDGGMTATMPTLPIWNDLENAVDQGRMKDDSLKKTEFLPEDNAADDTEQPEVYRGKGGESKQKIIEIIPDNKEKTLPPLPLWDENMFKEFLNHKNNVK